MSSTYHDEWEWKCAGCAGRVKLTLNIAARNLAASSNPARYIAQERLTIERNAAGLHSQTCTRPV